MKLDELGALIDLLRAKGVQRYVGEGISLDLGPAPAQAVQTPAPQEEEKEKPGPDGLTKAEQELFYAGSRGR